MKGMLVLLSGRSFVKSSFFIIPSPIDWLKGTRKLGFGGFFVDEPFESFGISRDFSVGFDF